MKALRKLVLGETWALPLGVALVLAGGLALRDEGWFHSAGGFALLVGVVVVLSAALPRRR